MIRNEANRLVRFISIDPDNGNVLASITTSGPYNEYDNANNLIEDVLNTEESIFERYKKLYEEKGEKIIRLCNHENCFPVNLALLKSPCPKDSDGNFYLEFKDGINENIHLWEQEMERAFIKVIDDTPSSIVAQIIRLEPGEWSNDLKRKELHLINDALGQQRIVEKVKENDGKIRMRSITDNSVVKVLEEIEGKDVEVDGR